MAIGLGNLILQTPGGRFRRRLTAAFRGAGRPGAGVRAARFALGLLLGFQLAVGAPILCLVHCLLLPSLHQHHHHMMGGMMMDGMAMDGQMANGMPALADSCSGMSEMPAGGQIQSSQPMPAAVYAATLPPRSSASPQPAPRPLPPPIILSQTQWTAPIVAPPPRRPA